MRINFIVPSPKLNMYRLGGIRIPQIGVLYLATILKQAGHDVKVYDENITNIINFHGMLKPEIFDADAFGISILTCSAYKGYNYSRQIKKHNPDSKIVIGGMHASAIPAEAAVYADYVVTGEGENVIKEVFETNPQRKIIEGDLSDIHSLPNPDFSLLYDNNKVTDYPVLASRGCPYNCNFCQVPITLKRKHRARTPLHIFNELKERKTIGQESIFFNDDIFGLKVNDTISYLKQLIRHKIKFEGCSAETRTNVLSQNPKLVKLMNRVGFKVIHLGIESASEEGLASYNKCQTLNDIEHAVKVAHDHDIKINGMFIFGSESDDMNIVKTTKQFYKRIKLDTATISILYPIPGTPLFKSLEQKGRILTKNWSLYDGAHVVFTPKNLTPLQLQKYWKKIWRKIYPALNKYGIIIRTYLPHWHFNNLKYLKSLKRCHFRF